MASEIINDMLTLQTPILFDNSIERKEYKTFVPLSKAEFNTATHTIEIDIPAKDRYYRPSDSFLHIKGRLVRNDNEQRYNANAQITLINNSLMYLFSSIEYKLGDKVMETLNFPGQTTSIIGYLSYPDDFNTSTGLKQCWKKDTNVGAAASSKYTNSPAVAAGAAIAAGHFTPRHNPDYNEGFAERRSLLLNNDNPGSFSFTIPFSHIFGFAEYNKIIYNLSQNLKVTRASDNLAIHRAAQDVVDGKIILTDIKWIIPKITPSVQMRTQLLQSVKDKAAIPIHFCGRSDYHTTITANHRSFEWLLNKQSGVEKPRWIMVAFQTDKNTAQTQNPAVFDHINLSGATASLDGDKYPSDDVEIDFTTNNYVRFYEMADEFKREYYQINNLIGGTQIDFRSYKSLYPILVFDVRHQSEQVKDNVTSIVLSFKFNDDVPANTHAYAVVISDRLFKVSSNGESPVMVTY